MTANKKPPLYCSFCGKQDGEVFILIAGPTVFICDECIDLCAAILLEKREAATAENEWRGAAAILQGADA